MIAWFFTKNVVLSLLIYLVAYLVIGRYKKHIESKQIKQLKKNAANGDPKSLFDLSTELFNKGEECSNQEKAKNYKHKSFEFLLEAAEKGYAEAQYSLGYDYFYGIENEQNIIKAIDWLTKASNQNPKKVLFYGSD